MTTVLLLVLFIYELKFPGFFTAKIIYTQKAIEEPFWQYGKYVCSNRDSLSFWGCKLRYLFFRRKGTGAKWVAMTTNLHNSFCPPFDLYLWCEVWRSTRKYFQRYYWISIYPFFNSQQHDAMTLLICIIQKRQYPKRKN